MPQIRGRKGEAVVVYRESLITKEMGYHGLSRRVNKMEFFYYLVHKGKNYKHKSEIFYA